MLHRHKGNAVLMFGATYGMTRVEQYSTVASTLQNTKKRASQTNSSTLQLLR